MNNSIPQRIIIETVDKTGFWSNDNPLWIILAVVVTSILTCFISYPMSKTTKSSIHLLGDEFRGDNHSKTSMSKYGY